METLVRLPLPVDRNRNRRPDVAFVSAQRIAEAPPQPGSDNAWDIVPELMVEVISPHDLAEEIVDAHRRILGRWHATRLGRLSDTDDLYYVYESPGQMRILRAADELDGGEVLPGLRIAIASLFPG